MIMLSVGNVTEIKINPTVPWFGNDSMDDLYDFTWRKGDVYEKKWCIDAGIQPAVQIRNRWIFKGSL